MFKNALVLVGFAMAAVLSMPARGGTIDTFSFTESGWSDYTIGSGVLIPEPTNLLTGSFTGSVEPDGFIEQGDLTQFSVQYANGELVLGSSSLNELSLFSYDTAPAGGPSSLDFAGNPGDATNVCIGAATSLDPVCTLDFNVLYAPGTVVAVEIDGTPDFVSSSAPQITLVSSSTTSAVPEPASLFLECIGLGVVVILARLCPRFVGFLA
jgi:hypothetical protein